MLIRVKPKCSKRLSWLLPKLCLRVFRTKRKLSKRLANSHFQPTCAHRCEDLSGDVFKQLLSKLRACPWSIALDKITDRSDIAQLLLIPLKGTTTAADICNALLQLGQENELTWDNLVSICTDGSPSMLGHTAGLIHQQALCGKGGCGLQETMQTVVEIVNLIRTRALNHRRFQNHMATFDAEYDDVLFYNSVRWLSRGAVLERFVALLPHIISFLEEIGRPVAKLDT